MQVPLPELLLIALFSQWRDDRRGAGKSERAAPRGLRLGGEQGVRRNYRGLRRAERFGASAHSSRWIPPPKRRNPQGAAKYNGDGTGTATQHASFINLSVNPPGIPIEDLEGTCELTYSVSQGGSVIQQRSCVSTVVAGAAAGSLATIVEIETRGQIVQGNTAVIYGSGDQPGVETLTNTPPGGKTTTTFRVCTRRGVISKISPR